MHKHWQTIEDLLERVDNQLAENLALIAEAKARIAELESQLAERDEWTPIPDGDYEWSDDGPVVGLTEEGFLVLQEGHAICRRVPTERTPQAVEVHPPQHLREHVAMELGCDIDELRFVLYNDTAKGEWLERTPVAATPQGQPMPDWTTLPTRAAWWCVDADGRVAISEDVEPIAQEGWSTWTHAHGILDGGNLPVRVSIPIGTDWRLLKVQRPQPWDAAKEGGEDDGE